MMHRVENFMKHKYVKPYRRTAEKTRKYYKETKRLNLQQEIDENEL